MDIALTTAQAKEHEAQLVMALEFAETEKQYEQALAQLRQFQADNAELFDY